MPFTIQSNDLAGVPARQSVWYSTDIAILVAGEAGTGVLTGCDVTAQGSPDMTLAVASGTIQPSAGAGAVTVTAGNVTITTAHATLPRIDLVTASAAGVKTVTAGTAATEPKPPDLPSGHIGLAMVDVPAADTAIQTAQITSKRAIVFASAGSALTVQEADGTPTDSAVTKIIFPNGTLSITSHEATFTPTGGGGVTVQDEGSPLATVADTLNFVGAGVVATGAGTTKTITVSGAAVADILDLPTAEMTTTKVLAPDGAGGVEFRAEAGGGGGGSPADAAASLVTAYSLFR
jgi:hypothetical protein